MLSELLRKFPFSSPRSGNRSGNRSSAALRQHFTPALEPLEERRLLSFTVLNNNSWDFESEDLGDYTDAEIAQDFDYLDLKNEESGANSNYGPTAHIVMDTINGQPTKVMRITDLANDLGHGFYMMVDLGADYDEIYFTYNWKFADNFQSTEGGKMPGVAGSPEPPPMPNPPRVPYPDEGFVCKPNFKQAGRVYPYHYDQTLDYVPWAPATGERDIYLNNGNWYTITERVVMNTFVGTVAQADGIHELWVDGRMTYQETNLKLATKQVSNIDGEPIKIDGLGISHWYGGDNADYTCTVETYAYLDNMIVYLDDNPDVDENNLHDTEDTLVTPYQIDPVYRAVKADTVITTGGTLHNAEYGSNYSICQDETYLIDAGAGGKVTFNLASYNLAAGSTLLFYDGNTTDAPLLGNAIVGPSSGSNITIERPAGSTSQYMFVRFATDKHMGAAGWTGTVTLTGGNGTPTRPVELGATGISSTQITLNWDDTSADETSFEIDRQVVGGNWTTNYATAAQNATSYTDNSCAANTTYNYRVRATNGSGDSSSSIPASATTFATGTHTMTLYSIATEDGLVDERTEYSSDGTSCDASIINAGIRLGDHQGNRQRLGILSFDTSALPNDATIDSASLQMCYTQVEAQWDGQNNPFIWGGALYADIKSTGGGFGTTPALEIADFQYSVAGTSDATQVVQFSEPDGLDDLGTIVSGTVASSGCSYIDKLGKTQFRVRFENGDNNDNAEDWVGFDTGASLTEKQPQLIVTYTIAGGAAPNAPTNLSATATSATNVNLTWTDNATTETGFEIDRSTDGSNWSQITTADSHYSTGTMTYTDSNSLSEGTTYYYRVRATNGTDSSNSNTASATTKPATPTLNGSVASSTAINLTWGDVGSENRYEIDRKVGDGSWVTNYTTVAANTTSYNNAGLTTGTTYSYRVRASISGSNDSLDSNEVSATPTAGPAAPTNLTAATIAATTNQLCLTWTDNATNETGFEIDRSTNGSNWSQITTVNSQASTGSMTYTDSSSLSEGTMYYYRVRATNGSGDSNNCPGTSPYYVTATTAPAAPTASATAGTTSVNVTWNDGAHEDLYEIDRKVGAGNWESYTTCSANATSFSNTGLTAGTTYYYRVRASIGGSNDSANSNDASATPTGGGSGTLTVYSVASEDGYVYEANRDANSGSSYEAGNNDQGLRVGDESNKAQYKSILSFNTSGLPDNATITSATLRMRRSGLWGSSPFGWSGNALLVDIKGGTGFGGYTALAAADFQNTADATSVVTGGMSNPASTGAWSTGDLASGLTNINLTGTTQFRVYFSNPDNNDNYTNLMAFYTGGAADGYKPELIINYTTDVTPPAAPTNLTAATIAATTNQLCLTWTDNATNETGFEIDRSTNGSNWSQITTVNSQASTGSMTYTDSSSLSEGTMYYYRVRATNGSGDSNNCPGTSPYYVTATTAPAAPTASATAGTTSVNVTWNDGAHEDLYEIDRKVGAGNWESYTTCSANATSFSNTGLTAGTTYYYRVRASIGGSNDSANSNDASATPTGGGSGTLTVYSVASEDGYVYEANRDANSGSSYEAGNNDQGLRVGDESNKAQYKSILSFNTSGLPDNATITSATLRMRRSGLWGSSPFGWSGNALLVDIKGGTGFGGYTALAAADFQNTADATSVVTGGMSNPASTGAWSTGDLASGLTNINLTGTTQFRVYFSNPDNNDNYTNLMAFYTGGAADGYKPELIINYTTPMRAADGEVTGREVEALTQETLDPVVDMAMARWEALMRGTGQVAAVWGNYVDSALANVQVVISDLPGDMLGSASGSTIYLDTDAAGHGWYADQLFSKNLNFKEKEGVGMDLLTVVSHELGHVLGLDHAKRGVMSGTLEEGVRELPTRGDLRGLSSMHGRALAAAINSLWDDAQDESEELLARV